MEHNPQTPWQRDAASDAPDIESSTDAYATRFAGPVGEWMLHVQESLSLGLLADCPAGTSVLDVGGGHGQLALPLAADRFEVTVLGSDDSCSARLRPELARGRLRFAKGPLTAIPFADRSFDVALSFRILPHCREWERLVAELCRVARDRVVVDYPASQSVNRIAPWLFEAKKKVESNTRHWRSFRHREVATAFASAGYRLHALRKQFFLPMAMHRMLKCTSASAAAEAAARMIGLTRLWGSPVIAEFRRAPQLQDPP